MTVAAMPDQNQERQLAAQAAVNLVEDGMVVGLGTGGTAAFAIRLLAQRCQEGLTITGIPTSTRSAALAAELGIPLVELHATAQIDLTIDGADEFDAQLHLTKGGGGALMREKIVAFNSRQVAIITDSAKRVDKLGRFPLPCEVLPFAAHAVASWIEKTFSIQASLRLAPDGSGPFITDQGNQILDCHFGIIDDPPQLAAKLHNVPGLLEHGLFIAMADVLFMGTSDGVKEFRRSSSPGAVV
jgi:ribose 5-phosphate isomerase A